MLVLFVIGVLLVVFGGLVLLLYPSAVGGKVALAGLEVSSTSAGLPLIALGVISVALSAGDATGRLPFRDGTGDLIGAASGDGGCFGDVPAERTMNVEAGVEDLDLLGPREPLDQPFALRLTRNGEPVGELKMQFFPENDLFRVVEALDAGCGSIALIENASRGGDPLSLQNWDTLQFEVGERAFALRIGEDGGIVGVNYFREIAR